VVPPCTTKAAILPGMLRFVVGRRLVEVDVG
jgi:hypothetical protein